MTQTQLFNSPFEMGLRIILLLSASSRQPCTVDRIVGLDFITCYAADFDLPYPNLHGMNNYKYCEPKTSGTGGSEGSCYYWNDQCER